MTKEAYWTNDDGLVIGFGTRTAEDQRGSVTRTSGELNEFVIEFAYDDLPAGSATVAVDGSYTRIPANAVVVDAYLEVTTGFAGGTSYDIGLDQTDGTAIDANGLWDTLVLADINSAGDKSSAREHGGTASGALFGSAISADAVPIVTATGTFTAGTARLVIRYVG